MIGPSSDASPYDLLDAEAAGVDPAGLAALVERAQREIDTGLLPSCQLALARHGRLVLFAGLGEATTRDRFVIFSATKGIVAGAVWLAVGDGLVRFDQPVADIVPEFATNGKDAVTVEQLLAHTSGFPHAPLGHEPAARREDRLARFARWRLTFEPGTAFEYHPTAAHWVLREILERVTGTDLRTYVHDRIMNPLGLRAFALGEPPERQDDVATLVETGEPPTPEEIEAAIGIRIDLTALLGEVTQAALLEFNRPEVRALAVPGAGGISTAADVALYYQGLLHDPDGLWRPEVLAAGLELVNDFPDPVRGTPAHRSRGMQLAGPAPGAQLRGFGHGVSPATFGHDGAGGQVAWADPVSGLSFCYLTNGLDAHLIRQARRSIGLSSRAAACVAA
ncbi:MAG: beta-lactamase family protein [Acidimicrobiales bacterium]|jgi:CubicO group peptidase (beta-lactamase class C family)|nr:beta-lactamase family protein [Acidimicrobiales bacterium]